MQSAKSAYAAPLRGPLRAPSATGIPARTAPEAVTHDVEIQGGGETEGINPVEDAAVAFDQGTPVLDAAFPFDGRHDEAAEETQRA